VRYRIRVRVVCARAYHALFMRNMLIRPSKEELEHFHPDYVIYNGGAFPANRYTAGMTSSTSVAINFAEQEMVILGTEYAGESLFLYCFLPSTDPFLPRTPSFLDQMCSYPSRMYLSYVEEGEGFNDAPSPTLKGFENCFSRLSPFITRHLQELPVASSPTSSAVRPNGGYHLRHPRCPDSSDLGCTPWLFLDQSSLSHCSSYSGMCF
jgi:hypothetical protein